MKTGVRFATNKGNNYLYNSRHNRFQFCHPVLKHLLDLHRGGIDVKGWVKNLKGADSNIGGEIFSEEEIEYYYRKYSALLKIGFLDETENDDRPFAEVQPADIHKMLANTGQITFEVTDACNLKCDYCGYGKFYCNYDKRENRNLSFAFAVSILNYMSDLWNSNLNKSHGKNIFISFYGGEPLLNFPFIEQVVRYIRKLKILHNRVTFSITTNGILLDKYIEFFVTYDFNVMVSLDGNAENNSYRVFKNGEPGYEKLLEILKMVRAKYPDYFRRKITFNAVLHNKNSVAEIHEYFKKSFGKVPTIGELNTSGIKDSQKEEFLRTYSNINESLYKSENYSAIEREMFINLPGIQSTGIFLNKYSNCAYWDYNQLLSRHGEAKGLVTGTCYPFSKKIFVTVNGKILPCERIGHQYALGNVDEKGVQLNFENIAAKYNAYYDKMRKQCIACYNRKACVQCMYHLNIDSEAPKCHGFMNLKNFSKYLSNQISYLEKNPDFYSRIMREVVLA